MKQSTPRLVLDIFPTGQLVNVGCSHMVCNVTVMAKQVIGVLLIKKPPQSPSLQHGLALKLESGLPLRPAIRYAILVELICLPHPKINTILRLPTLPNPSLPNNLIHHNSMSRILLITKTSLSLKSQIPKSMPLATVHSLLYYSY